MNSKDKYSELPDSRLWMLITKNDKEAFEHLYRRYYTPLLAYALSFRYDEDLAKDCIQDMFVTLFLSETLYPIEYVKAYLFKSLRNLLLKRLTMVVENVGLEDNPVQDFLIEDFELMKLFAQEDDSLMKSRMLMNACNQLSDNQKNAIYLYYIKEFTWDEMAASLDISPHSCMNLVARSVAKLKKIIGVG